MRGSRSAAPHTLHVPHRCGRRHVLRSGAGHTRQHAGHAPAAGQPVSPGRTVGIRPRRIRSTPPVLCGDVGGGGALVDRFRPIGVHRDTGCGDSTERASRSQDDTGRRRHGRGQMRRDRQSDGSGDIAHPGGPDVHPPLGRAWRLPRQHNGGRATCRTGTYDFGRETRKEDRGYGHHGALLRRGADRYDRHPAHEQHVRL